tara:strand:- start:6 stop:236 length:231 start_codon:yes stop_codon:yes gene_type:complete
MKFADFDEAYKPTINNLSPEPVCKSGECFVASYPPVTPAGEVGPFFTNTYLLQSDRRKEVAGPVPVRSRDFSAKTN